MHPDTLSTKTVYLLWRANLALRSTVNIFSQSNQLTLRRFRILMLLQGHDGMSAAELARNLNVSRQATAEVVRDLERQNLIVRQREGDNRKVLRLRVTEAGREYLVTANRAFDAAEEYLMKDFSPEEIQAFRGMVSDITDKAKTLAQSCPDFALAYIV